MKHKNKKVNQQKRTYFSDKVIQYHSVLNDGFFADLEKVTGWSPQRLREATEEAITTRHHEAFFEHESDKARGNRPDVFSLRIDSVQVFYTVQQDIVMVRGYGWKLNREPLDDMDGGGFYCDNDWD